MRTIILLSLTLISMSIYRDRARALGPAKYYVSVSDGDDNNNGTSAATPWKTIARVNTAWNQGTFKAGDNILLKAGDVWSGTNLTTLVVKTSGKSEGASINVSSYGAGSKPQLNGLVTLTGWIPAGGNIYYTTNTNLGSSVRSVLKNGVELGEGRYPDADAPNKGYLKFETATANNSISDNELPASPDWTGYDVVCRVKAFVTERRNISSHSGHNITVDKNFTQKIQAGLGYFITGGANGLKVLTKNDEWWYNAANRRVYMYSSTGAPTGTIEATAVSNLINSDNYSYVHFNNLSLRGANDIAISVGTTIKNAGGAGFQFTNMKIEYAGTAVYLREHDDAYFYGDSVINCGGRGILAYNSSNHIIRRCYIDNINLFPEQSVDGDGGGIGIYTRLQGVIDSNQIRHCGYNSIRFDGDNVLIRNNFMYEWNLTKNDGAAVYYVRGSKGAIRNGWQVTNNLAIGNGKGAWEGSSSGTNLQTSCFYFDNDAQNGYIAGNVGSGAEYGLYLHRGYGHIIRDNLFYNNIKCQVYLNGDKPTSELIRSITFQANTLISAAPSQYTLYVSDASGDVSSVFNSIDSNKYYRPRDDNKVIFDNGTTRTRTEWKNAHTTPVAFDVHSTTPSPATYDSDAAQNASMIFVYNPTFATAPESLSKKYVNSNGKAYSGKMIKSPLGAYVLFKTD